MTLRTKLKAFLEKYLDYLPLIPIYGFLSGLPGGAIPLHNIYYFIIWVVTIPVWIFLIMATLKIKRMGKSSRGGSNGPV